MSEEPVQNTDRELFREDTGDPAGSYYENSVHVTASGGIGMSVGGSVIVKPIAEWHRLGMEAREARLLSAFNDPEFRASDDPDRGVLLARITIERRLVGDQDVIYYRAEDGDGDLPPLIEQLGMLTMSVDTATREAAGEVPEDDGPFDEEPE